MIISPADPVMAKAENLWSFNSSSLAEREVICRCFTAVKRQMLTGPCLLISEISGVMACISVTYENMKFYKTLQNKTKIWSDKTRLWWDKKSCSPLSVRYSQVLFNRKVLLGPKNRFCYINMSAVKCSLWAGYIIKI